MINICPATCKLELMFILLYRCSDDVAPLGPLTQRLIAGLVEENVLVSDIENKGNSVVIRKDMYLVKHTPLDS